MAFIAHRFHQFLTWLLAPFLRPMLLPILARLDTVEEVQTNVLGRANASLLPLTKRQHRRFIEDHQGCICPICSRRRDTADFEIDLFFGPLRVRLFDAWMICADCWRALNVTRKCERLTVMGLFGIYIERFKATILLPGQREMGF